MAGSAIFPESDPRVPGRPLVGRGRWLRAAPFAAIAVLGVSLAAADPLRHLLAWAAAAGLLVIILLSAAFLPWHRWPAGWQAAPAIAFFAVADLVAFATGEYLQAVFLGLLPIIWLAIYHTRRVALLGLAALGVALVIPPVLSPASFPDLSWYYPAMAFALSGLGGLAVQQLVNRSRTVATQAQADRELGDAYLNTAPCLVVILDRAGRVVVFNRLAEELTGYRSDQVRGETIWHLGRRPGPAQGVFEEVLAGNWPAHYEGDLRTTDGHRRILWSASGLVDKTGEVSHVVSTGVDITEQRAGERLLSNVLAAATQQMIMATDSRGIFTLFNVGAERLLGYRAEELIGIRDVAVIHAPEEIGALVAEFGPANFQELLVSGTPPGELIVAREWTLVRKDGSRFPAAMTVTTMVEDGAPVGYAIVAEDITDRRQAEAATAEALQREREAADRLRELDQVKSDFVATVSHDLRTPLTSITGNTELLLDGDAGELNRRQSRLLSAIDRNAHRLDTLVGDLLLLSRIESGTLRLQPRAVPLQEVIDGALDALTAKRSADVSLEVSAPAEPVIIQVDPAQLERVLTNLLSNAFKFTPPGGQVRLAAEVDRAGVHLRVSDTGIGIPEPELPHVFDRFFRTSRSQATNHPGSGLGLTIAKSIVEQHHGTIAASANPQGGTIFTVTLPPAAVDSATGRPA